MENASKALIMAGGIFIALLTVSILVLLFNNIRVLQNTEETADAIEQAAEFNKQYDVYDRSNLYGSEILSLANKMDDYNQKQAQEKGYLAIAMEVTFNQDVGSYFKKGTYTQTKLRQTLKSLEEKIDEYAKMTYCGKKISDLSSMRTNELNLLFENHNKTKSELEEAKAMISKYVTVKAEQTEIKSKTFRCVNVQYDDVTGRITVMSFVAN